jgi:hypothetical protein
MMIMRIKRIILRKVEMRNPKKMEFKVNKSKMVRPSWMKLLKAKHKPRVKSMRTQKRNPKSQRKRKILLMEN